MPVPPGRGEGSPLFTDVSAAVDFDDDEWGSGLIAADLDRDGDLDLVQACASGALRILENRLDWQGHHYLVVKPRREDAFPYPLGAVVEVQVGDTSMRRLITAGTSFMSQEPAEAVFGLGAVVGCRSSHRALAWWRQFDSDRCQCRPDTGRERSPHA